MRSVAADVTGLGCKATDVSSQSDVRALYEPYLSLADGVHLVMNNAGIARFGRALERTDDDWKVQRVAEDLAHGAGRIARSLARTWLGC